MTESTSQQRDVEILFDAMVGLGEGATIGNKKLRTTIGWAQRGRFERARDTLIAAGAIQVLPGGRGGRLTLTDGLATVMPELDTLSVATERALYTSLTGLLHEVLRLGDEATPDDDLEDNDVAVDVVADRGGAMTGGRYSRPDLVAAVRRRLTSFDALEVHGFEVKPYWSADRVSVYEAVAQRALSLCTHSWVVLYLPDDTIALSPDDRALVAGALARLPRVQREAADLGVGLIVVRHVDDDGVDVLEHATRVAADPRRLDEFVRAAAPMLLAKVGIVPKTALA